MSDQVEEALPVEDVRAIVRLVAESSEAPGTLIDRKRVLLSGLAQLVGADVWVWTGTAGHADEPMVGVAILDGGWKDDQERTLAFESMSTGTFEETISRRFLPYRELHVTRSREQVVPDADWYGSEFVKRYYTPLGFTDFILSFQPLGNRFYSGTGLHRRAGRPPFGERERCIVHVVTGEVAWLHQMTTDESVNEAKSLSPRLRQILLHLLTGDSRKQIAQKMRLSEHTIASYMKILHRHFNVSSRGELMAMFMAGGPTSPPPADARAG